LKKYSNIELEKELTEDVGVSNFTALALKYNIARQTVRAFAKRIGAHKGNTIKLKKYSLDVNYFKSIDTINKAYILGFIYADGCNTRRGLQIGLHEKDKEVLEFIKKELNADNALTYIKPFKKGWSYKWDLRISSKELSNDLTEKGCPPAKSLIVKFPDFIDDNLMPHFIRGYFDGDGCITICDKGYGRLYFTCGSKDFIEGLRNYFYKQTGHLLPLYDKNCYSLMTSKQVAVKSIINLMYTDSTFSMQRKHQIASVLMVEKRR
jgi:hypothetical protein